MQATAKRQAPRASDLYLQAEGFLDQSNKAESVDKAIALYRQSLEQEPDFAAAHAGLCQAYWRKYRETRDPQHIENALKSGHRAVELNDREAPPHICLGFIFASTGQLDKAVTAFRAALKLDPENADGYRGLARAHETAGQLDKAEKAYNQAIQLRPKEWIGYSHLGVFYYRHGRYTEAGKMFRKIRKLAPENYVGPRLLGGLYLAKGQYAKAEQVLKEGLEIRQHASIQNNLASVYYFKNRYAEAARLMEKAIKSRPNDHLYWSNKADILRATGDSEGEARSASEKAIELAEKALDVTPNDGELLSDLALHYAKISNTKDALGKIERALKIEPNNKDVLLNAILVYERTGKRARALQVVKETITRGFPAVEIRRHPALAKLRSDPEYRRLMHGRK